MDRKKILKVGDSAAITIPSAFLRQVRWKTGQEVIVEADPRTETLVVRSARRARQSGISAEFAAWVEEFIEEHRPMLETLAKK